jgi:hypothetical protein
VRIAVLCAIALIGAGCQIDSRSDTFRCELPTDCTDGRTCVGGWCVGEDAIDASVVDTIPDANLCPSECTECLGSTCVIRCEGADSCGIGLVCPAGVPCLVVCSGDGSCGGGIDCSDATACEIDCTGPTSCGGAITCGTGPCDVGCTAADTCADGVACQDSCACDVLCGGAGSCATPAQCAFTATCDTGAGCRSAPGACHSC